MKQNYEAFEKALYDFAVSFVYEYPELTVLLIDALRENAGK